MIPVLLFGAAALYTVASHSAINDLKEEIEEIQDESQQMIDETRELIDVTNENLKGACSKAFKQRENIYKTTLKKATEITNKIKIKEENVVLCNERQEVVDKISSIKESTFAKKSKPYSRYSNWCCRSIFRSSGRWGNCLYYCWSENDYKKLMKQKKKEQEYVVSVKMQKHSVQR